MSDPGWSAAECEDLLFQFGSAHKVISSLSSGTVWLTPYSRMNDPAEREPWTVEISGGTLTPDERDAAAREVDRQLRRAGRLACFARDKPAATATATDRVWEREHMWRDYAAEHSGAILVFDLTELCAAVNERPDPGDRDVFGSSPVAYSRRPREVVIDGSELQRLGAADTVDQYQTARGRPGILYFTKGVEWSLESEFRIVVVRCGMDATEQEEPIRVRFGTSLRAVVLGSACDPTDRQKIERLAITIPDVIVLTSQRAAAGGGLRLGLP